jgi:hypothetical protein
MAIFSGPGRSHERNCSAWEECSIGIVKQAADLQTIAWSQRSSSTLLCAVECSLQAGGASLSTAYAD